MLTELALKHSRILQQFNEINDLHQKAIDRNGAAIKAVTDGVDNIANAIARIEDSLKEAHEDLSVLWGKVGKRSEND